MVAWRRVLEWCAAAAFVYAAIVWGLALVDSLSGRDAGGPLLLGDLVSIASYVLGAAVLRSWLGTGVAILAVPYFLFDGLLRALGGGLATDGARPVSAITFYQGSSSLYPMLGCVLILGFAFALKGRAPLAWPGGLIACAVTLVIGLLGRDAAIVAGAWYLFVAVELARPRRGVP